MKREEFESYYFATEPFKKIREKHFPKIKEILDSNEFFNNQNLSEDEVDAKRFHMEEKLYKYISSCKRIRRDFYNAYGVITIDSLCELVMQSILADEVLKKELHIDIYLDAQSVICTYEDCPMNIWHYYNQQHSLAEYSKIYSKWYDNFEDLSEDDIFGLEFENE